MTQCGFRQNYSATQAISYINGKLIKNANNGLYQDVQPTAH